MKKKISKLLKVKEFRYVVFQINNYCNLHCEYCNYLCNSPISAEAENIWRRAKKEIEIDEAILYCEKFKDIKIPETQWTGGEPTLLSEDKFHELIEIFYFYNKKINLLTNGYNLLNLDRNIIKKIHKITFDDHCINRKHIDNCISFLRAFYKGKIEIWTVKEHYDLKAAMKHPSNKGKMCDRWLTEVKINDYVVYPCCTMPAMMVLDNDTKIKDELTRAGWTLHNKNLLDSMRNYRETLPQFVQDQCLDNCWMPNQYVGQQKLKITLKPYDKINKEVFNEVS